MLLMQSTAAAAPPARSLQAPLLWRALAALTLLLSSFGSLEVAQQGDQIAAASQEEALLQFKSAFPGWGTVLAGHSLQGWQPAAAAAGSGSAAAGSSGPCGWSFVECDGSGHVIRLELSPAVLWQISVCGGDGKLYTKHQECQVQLQAPLAALMQPLSRLPALQHLTLSELGLTGSLPPEWAAALPALQSLDLSGNALTAGLPAAWIAPGSWPALAVLDLSHNPLGGSLPSILPAALNATAARATVQGWIDRNQYAGQLPPPPPLQQLMLSGCQLSGRLPFDWALLDGLMLLWLNDNRLTGTMPPNWGSPNPLAEHVEDLNLWLQGASVHVQRNQLQGPVACCEMQTMVQPGNDGLCLPGVATVRTEMRRAPNTPIGFTRQAPAAGHQQQYGGPTELLVGSSSPCTSSGRSSRSGGAAGSRDGSRERLGTHSSWRLRSRSLQLKADDFQILLDKAGRPDLLGAGATAKVYRGLLFGSQPVAIKVLAPAAACKLLESPLGAAAARATAGEGASSQQQQELQQQQQEQQEQEQEITQQQRQHERNMWREVELLRQCRHPNLVQLLGVYVSPAQQQRRLMLVTELLEGGSLAGRLGEPALRWYRCGGRVALDAARGLAFLHWLGIAHRDVKSANILLTTSCLLDCLPERLNGIGAERSSSSGGGGDASEGGSASLPDGAAVQPDTSDLEFHSAPLAKLGDVGLARALDQGSMSLVGGGTILYAAPEQLANSSPGLAADLFSLAWVIHEIATGERLLRRGQGRPLRAPEDCPAAIVQLVERCLQTDPAARPTAAEAVQVIAANLHG